MSVSITIGHKQHLINLRRKDGGKGEVGGRQIQ